MTMPPARRATLEDVARLAGVSLGSASRALSTPDQLKPATLAAVEMAVAQLGYVRNGAARALASRRSRTIGAVYPTMFNPAFVESLQFLQETLSAERYHVILGVHDYSPEREYQVVRAVVERGVDGIVLVGTSHAEPVIDLLRRRRMPAVMTWEDRPPAYGDGVGFDNRRPLFDLTCEIIKRGHRHIAVVCGTGAHNDRVAERIQGTRDALHAVGLSLRSEWICEEAFSIDGGRRALARLLDGKKHPTAIVCHTDLQALGVLDECRSRSIRVPEQLSVTGMDDIDFAAMATPRLTSIAVPTRAMGSYAATRIIDLIEGRPRSNVPVLDCEIKLRESLGPVPASDATVGRRI